MHARIVRRCMRLCALLLLQLLPWPCYGLKWPS
jgi:hypothetical protein